MEKPFEFIEYKMQRLDEFKITEGRQPTYALFFLKEGSFRLEINGKETNVSENDCVVLSDDLKFLRNVPKNCRNETKRTVPKVSKLKL